ALMDLDFQWFYQHPNFTNAEWVIPAMGPLDRAQRYLYELSYLEDEAGLTLLYKASNGIQGEIRLDPSNHHLAEWLERYSVDGRHEVVTLRRFQEISGRLFLTRVERSQLDRGQMVRQERWAWENPRGINQNLALSQEFLPVEESNWTTLFALSDSVLAYQNSLSQLQARETKTLIDYRDKSKRRVIQSDFAIIPLETDPHQRVELRIPRLLDQKAVKVERELVDIFSQGFVTSEEERTKIRNFGQQYDWGDSPFGFTLTLAPSLADAFLALFEHRVTALPSGGFQVDSTQVRGVGVIRSGLYAFRPHVVVQCNAHFKIQSVAMDYELVRPYRISILAQYEENPMGITVPSRIVFKEYQADHLDFERIHQYGPFTPIKTDVQTSVQEFKSNH
ncbi:MAG: hypothetical protein KDC71_18435, partial [Acidobacteria bacterium]|nr:hypothetical protein [Acidobacteriota bacterium]